MAAKTTSRQFARQRYHVASAPGKSPTIKFCGRMPIASANSNVAIKYAFASRHPRKNIAMAKTTSTIDGTSLKAVPPKNQTFGKNAHIAAAITEVVNRNRSSRARRNIAGKRSIPAMRLIDCSARKSSCVKRRISFAAKI